MSISKTNGVCYNVSSEYYNNVTVSTDSVTGTIDIETDMILPEDDLFDTYIVIDSDTQTIVTNSVETSKTASCTCYSDNNIN